MTDKLSKAVAVTNENINSMESLTLQISKIINGDGKLEERLGAIQFFDDLTKVVNVLVSINNRNGRLE